MTAGTGSTYVTTSVVNSREKQMHPYFSRPVPHQFHVNLQSPRPSS